MSIKQLLAAGNIDGLLVLITLLYAAGFVVIRYILTRRSLNIGLGDHMGGEKWDFSSSWASTLTAVGAILGTTLTAQVLPTQPQIPKSVFVSLNLLFGVIIVVAALVYSATRRPKAVDTKAGVGSGIQYQGRVWAFLIASGMILWAVSGQLLTIFLILDEIRVASASGTTSMSVLAVGIFQVLLGLAVIFAGVYAWTGLHWTLDKQVERDLARQELINEMSDPGVAEVPAKEDLEPPLPGWSLL